VHLQRRLVRATLMALLLLLALTGIASAGVLRVRLNSDILSTEPGVLRDENTDAVLLHVVEGLVAYREDASVGPLLARAWDISGDGRVYTFHLRQGVRFHNGAPLTAAEVVWSFQRYLNPATHWRCSSEFSGSGLARILSVVAVDALTVRITLDKAAPLFLQTLARVDCGEAAILHPSSVAADGRWRAPVGTGPYRLENWQRNQYIELRRFENYASLDGPRDGNTGGKRAEVEVIRFLVIPDASAAEAALMRGSVDVLDGVLPLQLSRLRTQAGIQVDIHPIMDMYALLFQTRDPVLRDPRMRRAIALTLDVPALVKAVTLGTAEPNASLVPTRSAYHESAIQSAIPRPDLQEARRLAAAAGYKGEPIRLTTNHRYAAMFDVAVLAQAMARQAGIDLEIETLDWAAELDRYNHGRYQVMAFAYSARLDPALILEAMIGDKERDPRKVWDTPHARELLLQAQSTADRGARQIVFDRLQQQFLSDAPAVMLYNSARLVGLRSNVIGFSGWPAGQLRLWGVRLQ
jgi:peptide/nickel transport system substrate-binding protein